MYGVGWCDVGGLENPWISIAVTEDGDALDVGWDRLRGKAGGHFERWWWKLLRNVFDVTMLIDDAHR